ncbi:unnamed protein product [Danaus chrysippus]|uniref:(African queen) hypothetical protein n=1 Tax=Danaus chrysippus TaxID=151541 RepID=A0A8J2VWN6_9NEOP|nr:unnamed protein product [Danaus chrysippus]
MEQIVVKTEVQPNGDILLFYVDENEEADAGTFDQENGNVMHMLPETKYVIEDNGEGESADELDIAQAAEEVAKETWLNEEIKRLIVFYIDNKETFLSGTTKKKHLWAVACRTILTGKNPVSCEVKLRMLKQQFIQLCLEKQKGNIVTWPYYDLCHQAFYEDSFETVTNDSEPNKVIINMPVQNVVNQDGILVVKKVNSGQGKDVDEKVEAMLKLYIKHKKTFKRNNHMPRGLWETIALEMGEDDVEYWHKRFLNFKQHYVRMLYKKKESGPENIHWPYMKYFDHIFCDDEEFQKKFLPSNEDDDSQDTELQEDTWSDTEKTFLVKYYYDCFQEFQDSTIPNQFLWQEVGRLLNRKPDVCKDKYNELKNQHFNLLLERVYDMTNRVPMAIIFDNIIAKETLIELEQPAKRSDSSDIWKTEQIDELVEYLYENINMLKDLICYYVCWATISKKIERTVQSCMKQWDSLKTLYKSILEDKKENSDMQIDWRYIDLFDRIFDYGMDTNLLDGYEKTKELSNNTSNGKVGVKKITIKGDYENFAMDGTDDEESYDERGFTKRSKKRNGDTKAFKILEYYLKNKDKFSSSQQKKLALWEILAKQIGLSATECAHRFRNFKQVYIGYVQREINKPEMPILWPYYTLCKKVFGYRAIKSKLKNGKLESEDGEDWSAKEIKQLINYFSRNYHDLVDNIEDKSRWVQVAQEMGRTEGSCCDKFLELRKSYRKLKTMKSRNPDVKVSWKYFNMIDEIYQNGAENIEVLEEMDFEETTAFDVKTEIQEDDDFQCIIVVPEGDDINNAQIIIQDEKNSTEDNAEATGVRKNITVWNRKSKRRLLILYLKYLRSNKEREINTKDMWTEIASQLEAKTPVSCKKMYMKLKNQYNIDKEKNIITPYNAIIEKILAIKPRFAKSNKIKSLDDITVYNDVPMSEEKVLNALNYYMQNLEDFVSPKFEKRYLWIELAKYISESVTDVYSKINYMKQNHDNIDSPFREVVQAIIAKENTLKEVNKDLSTVKDDENEGQIWSDLEIERLLTWYLAHLDKFKNPKFVRSYLWMEASDILKKSPLVCSKKMLEIRSQYRSMVKENPEELNNWKFYNLCQRIYGTGKKSN